MLDQSYYEHAKHLCTDAPVKYIVSLSTGAGSAAAADIIIKRHGLHAVELVFADTLWEDTDNYRFLRDLEAYWGKQAIRLVDGRNPLEVAADRQIIPNNMMAPCTYELKIKPIIEYVKSRIASGYIPVMVIGHTVNDTSPRQHGQVRAPRGRLDSPINNWQKLGVTVEYPLLPPVKAFKDDGSILSWDGLPTNPDEYVKHVMGLELPRMYEEGYKHANCGGRCVKQGIKDWRRTLTHKPDNFAEAEKWEAEMRKDPRFANRSIVTRSIDGETVPYPLSQLRADVEGADDHQLRLFDMHADMQSTCGAECGVSGDWLVAAKETA